MGAAIRIEIKVTFIVPMINGKNPKFIKSVDDVVVEMYKKTIWSSPTMDESFVTDYEKITFLSS